jgi:hypothetical protein
MELVTIFSTVAMVLGLGGILPQLARMISSRSAAGQSSAGWGMGLVANLSMAYVNGTGFGAMLLCAYNIAGGLMCAAAMGLVLVLGRRPAPAPAAPDFAVGDMHTQELRGLREAVLAAEAARGQAVRGQAVRA